MRTLQALLLPFFLILWIPHPSSAQDSAPAHRAGPSSTRPSTAPASSESSLTATCDALLKTAVRRPYGWAWPVPTPSNLKLPRDTAFVSFEPLASSTAALLLYYAGQALDNPAYIQAAAQVARALAAAQQPNGRIPAFAVFGTFASPRDNPGPVPDRSPTCAALALLLTLAEDPTLNDPQIQRTATRAATWLVHQQPASGAWVVAGGPPEVADPSQGGTSRRSRGDQRSICLDSPDYRNSTFALLLSYEVLHDPAFRRAAEKAIDRLLTLSTDNPNKAKGLWRSTYDLRHQPTLQTLTGQPNHLDLLATRYALQTLLAAHLTLGSKSTSDALQTSAQTLQALETLRQKDGVDYRYYSLENNNLIPDRSLPAFGPAPQQASLSDLLAALTTLNRLGRLQYQDQLNASCNLKYQLAIALCGLSDDPPTLLLPMERMQMNNLILLINKDLSDIPSDTSTLDPSARTRRLWLELLRFKANAMAPRPN